ncbi:Trm112 family protein [Runella slithyformis]|uniref:Trm112 family protein n=1 Tax=Runella slithyformis (strain ATCC 29530 / DSM 19594 / LMG 11500 / NCIMB 11436 / LSU 4) TaxID=761193 RepID=A0A7U3ZLY7_RUNSL|nr:Trm112 family protein [Runella slithyformis]AEI49622.1 protein of unknown function DUF343 [Runella slithyformis DSM 19594]
MKPSFIHKLCCPFDKQDLSLTIIKKDMEGNIIEGLLTCESCRRYYPIVYGIPIMNPDEYREPQLEEPILKRWSKQLGSSFDEKLLK